ncbi:hypothetical protein AB0J74_22440 [Asanoa sp. NPDC049573]|uniref:hypothetical protein n=1 Tax=Asanoa sp. NPDC049573 TaxID=3155396 RepID=UPI003441CA3A
MYARSSTFVAETPSLDRGIAFVSDDLMGEMLALDGCVGLSLLVDRRTGRCVATSSWQSQESMRASGPAVEPIRARLLSAFDGSDLTNEEWEVAIMHRDHRSPTGARVRASYMRGDPSRAGQVTETFKSTLPAIEGFPGFCSASLLLNRDSGRSVWNVIFDSDDGLAQTRERANQLRADAAGRMGSDIIEVAEFELAFAHLRVPELV